MTKITKGISLLASAACFSTMLLLTSCSKENAVTPDSAITNESSNLRQGDPVFVPVYHFPSTDGPTCVGCTPNTWFFGKAARDATSSLTAYAGNPSKKWVQPLPMPATGSGSIITLVNDAIYNGYGVAFAENLIAGKDYKFTFSISTTSLNEANGPGPYASTATLQVSDFYNKDAIAEKVIDFNGKKNQWITETIKFKATHSMQQIDFNCKSAQGESRLTYTNIHVGKNAVQQLN